LSDPEYYRHTQQGHARIFSGAVVLVCSGLLITRGAWEEAHLWPSNVQLAILAAISLVHLVLYWSLSVAIDGGTLEWRFGLGLIRKRVALANVDSCTATRTTFWNGWGIHWTPRGWVYNVSGYGAVQVRQVSGKFFMLGTDEPEALAEALRDALAS